MLVNLLALALDRLLLPVAMLRPQARDRRTANRAAGPQRQAAARGRRNQTTTQEDAYDSVRLLVPPTRVHFGEGTTAKTLDTEITRMGDVVMLAFGGGSIRRSSPYDQVRGQLEAAGKTVVDFGGIMPNPTYAKAQEGATLAREHDVTDILAVGGSSVIDCCEAVAVQALLDEDIWQLEYAKGTLPTKGLA